MRIKKYLVFGKLHVLLLICWALSTAGNAQELPPIVKFSPDDYSADNQNWMISQSNDGHIYVANNKGLLEYSGANWTLYPSPNESIIRCVKAIGDLIYTGCYRNFGYWKRNKTGNLDYTSLSDSLQIDLIEDEHFWNIIEHNGWILFQSLDRILVFNIETKEIKSIEAEHTISKIFNLGDEIYFQVFNEGIYSVENGEKVLVDTSDIAKNSRIISLFMVEKSLTFVTEKDGFFKLVNSKLQPWNSPVDSLLDKLTIYSGLQAENGSLLIGSIANGVYHLSSEAKLLYNLNQTNGLSNNTALALFEDTDANIWVGLDNGVDCINTSAPLKNYVDRKGRLGTTYASAIYKNHVYLGTNQGLFYREVDKNEEFKLIEGTAGQVWYLKIIDNQLFCGHNSGTFLIDEDTIEVISDIQGGWDIKKLSPTSNRLLQGNYDGLYVFEKKDGIWQKPSKLEGFDISSRHFEITQSNNVIVNHEYKGVFELQIDSLFTKVVHFTKLESVNKAINSGLARFNDKIFYAGKNGIFSYDETQRNFIKDEALSIVFDNDEYFSGKMVPDSNNRLWVFTKSNLYYISKEKLGSSLRLDKIVLPKALRHGKEGFENISYYTKDRYILGTSNGYLLLDPSRSFKRDYEVKINKVISTSFSGDNTLFRLDEAGKFPAKQNSFIFEYSVPEYSKYLITEYQYKLEGHHSEWSHWEKSPSIAIENLKYGDYQFLVRAKINDQISPKVAQYNFVINRPLILSNAAIVVYALLTVLLFIGINWFYKRYYRKQRARILEKTTNELKLKELAAQKQIIQLKNQGLNQEIESRNRELAVSTINMISKNTTLNSIKDELKKFTNANELKPVIKLIDSSINNKQDWEFFEEAFNNADKDFFKKVKESHPKLTPNDLRLCVYLRLNLSSKEIAQLLNISTRSVEIKRYRLRKKIDLERKTNLNDYFINL